MRKEEVILADKTLLYVNCDVLISWEGKFQHLGASKH